MLVAAAVAFGCSAGRFRYDRLQDSKTVAVRELEDLVAAGAAGTPLAEGDVQTERVSYDFSAERDEYRLGRNDVLDIFVMDHPEMSSQRVNLGEISGTTVRKDGFVYLPVLERVSAAGMTLTEFEKALGAAATRYVVNPHVHVEIMKYESQKFFVLGEVQRPGAFPVDGDTTLLEGIGLAGGVAPTGNLEAATVVRGGTLLPISLADILKKGDITRNVHMRGGDLVYVPTAADQKVFVLGEVLNPQVVPITNNRITLAEALAAAGGPAPARARRELAVIRGGYARPIVYRIDLDKALLIDDQVLLRAGDRVVVAPTGLATGSRYMQQILPFLQGVQAIGLAANGATNLATTAAAAATTTPP